MRKLVNNWLFGEVSQLLTGRLDTEIYSAGCARLENMYVHRQGGISRRPPLKVEAQSWLLNDASRIIEFPISASESYTVLLGNGRVIIWDGSTASEVTLNSSSASDIQKWNSTWGDLSATELQEVRYANYYDDLYLVHKRCPLLLLRKVGLSFILIFPEIKRNQDVKRYNISLSISNFNPAVTTTANITIANDTHAIPRASTTFSDFLDDICTIQYNGWKAEKSGTTINFIPDNDADKYAEFKLANSTMTADELEDMEFKFSPVENIEFTYAFTATEDTDESGLVFAQDDFNDMELNTPNHYASSIAIISEKMWLAVNGNPCKMYVSRPYATSQIIHPKTSNDTILDFIQYQIVASDKESMKDEADLPVEIATDTNGQTVYKGTSYNQEIWSYSTDEITTKKEFDLAYEERKCELTYGEQPDRRGGTPYRRVVQIVSNSPSFTLQYAFVWHITNDGYEGEVLTYKVDTAKMTNNRGDWSSSIYRYLNGSQYSPITVDDAGTNGIKYRYFKTNDSYINPKTKYFTSPSSSSYVENPVQADLDDYYEREPMFTEDFREKVYEEDGQYVRSTAPTVALKTDYDEVNGRILKILENGTILVEAIPYYQFNMTTDADIYDTSTTIKKVATSSTGMEFQIASGRNDHITWVALGDDIMVGSENSEWRLNPAVNALDLSTKRYSTFGSMKGLITYVGTDLIVLEKGNKLRLFYKDDYGLQNIELTLTNPEILNGDIINMVGFLDPEPAIAILKSNMVNGQEKRSIVYLCLDRANGVQAFSRWDLPCYVYDIGLREESGEQKLIAVCKEDGTRFIAKFDFNEATKFLDCGCDYVKTNDTTITSGKTYYELVEDEYVVATPVSNPKTEGLYEIGPVDNQHGYTSLMRALPFDSQMQDGSVTLGDAKNVSKIIFRCLNTGKIVTWYSENEKDRNISRTPICCNTSGQYIGGLADFSKNVNGGTTRDLMIAVESYEDQPMTLLAMAYDVRTNRNGTGY